MEPSPSPGLLGPAVDARHAIAAPNNESIAMEAFLAVPAKLMGFLVLINVFTPFRRSRVSFCQPLACQLVAKACAVQPTRTSEVRRRRLYRFC